jgi:hypothetical protein
MEDYSHRHLRADSEYLYNHLLELRRKESPIDLIERFRYLFIDGLDYPEPSVLAALHRIAVSPGVEREFTLILNRCCYILVNYWWLHPEFRQATIELVNLFKDSHITAKNSRTVRRLQDLVRQFTLSEQYAELQDRARIVDKSPEDTSQTKNEPIRNLIPRYPYLYPYCVLTWDTSETGQQVVRQMQEAKERQFEQDLNLYLTHRLRRSSNSQKSGVKNPTLLSPEQVEAAVRKYVGKAEGPHTYRDLARQFVAYSKEAPSYRDVKREIYDYLTDPILHSEKPDYGKHHFNRWLAEQLEATLPQSDNLRPSNSMLVQTCGQLIDLLVASPTRLNHHVVFVDLNNNLGSTFTIGLLLKIVLLCREINSNLDVIKGHLARRFAIVLKHYESKVRGEIEWLVECLENLMVALSVHFGRADFSWVNLF